MKKGRNMARDIREGDLVDHLDFDGGVFRDRCLSGDVAGRLCANRGCHLVARKERLAEVWPTDEAFRRFAAEVADAVQAAIGRGVVISANGDPPPGCKCPLGCLPQAWGPYPTAMMFDRGVVGTVVQRQNFAQGFDGVPANFGNDLEPYYRLGQAYRRRFVWSES